MHQHHIMIDGHNDLPWAIREIGHGAVQQVPLRGEGVDPRLMTTIERLK